MKDFLQGITEQRGILIILAGGILLMGGAIDGRISWDGKTIPINPASQTVLTIFGGVLIVVGIVITMSENSIIDLSTLAKLGIHLPSSPRKITILAAERSILSPYYAEKSKSATTIDMISLTLLSAMENFGQEGFIQWIQAGKKIRILMLSPFSTAAELRSREESANKSFLPAKIIKQIEELKRLHIRAEKQLKGKDFTGSFEVRLFDDLPYFSYFHTDKIMVMGLYYGHIRGLQSEALLIDEKSSIHVKMRDHFDYLWKKSGRHSASTVTLCSITKEHIFFNHALLKSFQLPTR